MRNDRPSNDCGRDGFALVAALVFMLLVSAVVVPFALTARTRLMIAGNEVEQQRLALVADGLANVVAAELFDGLGSGNLPLDGEPTQCRNGHMTFKVRVQDHGGLIDLNAADAGLLTQGFASLGFDRQNAEALSASTISYRTPKSAFAAIAHHPTSSLGAPEDKHALFESVSELQEFSALASTPLHDLYNIFTVNSKRGSVNPANAPKDLREVLDGGRNPRAVGEPASSSAYTIEIAARREGSGIVGRAGFVVEKFPQLAAGFRRTSQNPVGDVADSVSASPPSMAGCDALFGGAVAEMLGKWAS